MPDTLTPSLSAEYGKWLQALHSQVYRVELTTQGYILDISEALEHKLNVNPKFLIGESFTELFKLPNFPDFRLVAGQLVQQGNLETDAMLNCKYPSKGCCNGLSAQVNCILLPVWTKSTRRLHRIHAFLRFPEVMGSGELRVTPTNWKAISG